MPTIEAPLILTKLQEKIMSTNQKAVDNFGDVKSLLNNGYEKSKKEAVKSGRDWLEYVEKHPLQTMLFGIIGYFALRGIFE
jgi:hypothetical protein